MLKLINIKKSYKTGDFVQAALDDFSLEFRENEFVAILGPSGSGKTTLLNIIGGLDKYDSGSLIISGKETTQFKAEDWDAYRNNSIGFVFQNYNLISHITILNNVEMGLNLSGMSAKKRRKKALNLLKRVGLEEHAHKKPNQLSGGQMQRVAIARALANDPDIILADEPTGALDTETSVQILNLIKEIAKDKLVIMVTHNAELAYKYANRIVKLKDGRLQDDSNPLIKETQKINYKIKKTAMSFWAALKLSFNNIRTKKGRTILTAFASSIGIIGIALILSLSNGFDKQIDKFEAETISSFPIIISQNNLDLDIDELNERHNEQYGVGKNLFPNNEEVYPYESIKEKITHQNKLTNEYIDYIEKIDEKLLSGITYMRMLNFNIYRENEEIDKVNVQDINFQSIPKQVNLNKKSYLNNNYDLLFGDYPKEKEDIILIVNPANKVSKGTLKALGLDSEVESINFKDIIDRELKIITNDNYYIEKDGFFTVSNIDKSYYNDDNITLKIKGIFRLKEDVKFAILNDGLAYQESLVDYMLDNYSKSKIVLKQLSSDYNVLTGQKFKTGSDELENLLSFLGGSSIPYMINLYPFNFSAKEDLLNYLDDFNKGKIETKHILYTDLSKTMSSLTSNIMDAITIVLISFSSISLIVSSIMIGIITYISVLERTKEIGILRSLGARKKDITRVFNAETFIVGLASGLLGIGIALILIVPINKLIKNLTELPNVALLNPIHALILIIVSLTLTVIGGYIPAIIASKKDPVRALRAE